MRSVAVYTAGRLGLFGLCWALVWVVVALVEDWRWSQSTALLSALFALVVSSLLSVVLLARQRETVARQVQARAQRISAALEQSRAKEDVD